MQQFLVMWCNEGLEALINVTKHEKENMIAVLREERPLHTNPIQYMILRAKFNQQRHYEIYAFESEIEEEDIRSLFEKTPQVIVDAIRSVGNKLYSDRKTTKDVIT